MARLLFIALKDFVVASAREREREREGKEIREEITVERARDTFVISIDSCVCIYVCVCLGVLYRAVKVVRFEYLENSIRFGLY